jgi:hypothetical protein
MIRATRTDTSRPRRSEYVKTLFTMSNNQASGQQALTTEYPPCARSIPMLQTVKTVLLCDDLNKAGSGGADRDRTGDLLLAKQALSQLSYGPRLRQGFGGLTPVPLTDRKGSPRRVALPSEAPHSAS